MLALGQAEGRGRSTNVRETLTGLGGSHVVYNRRSAAGGTRDERQSRYRGPARAAGEQVTRLRAVSPVPSDAHDPGTWPRGAARRGVELAVAALVLLDRTPRGDPMRPIPVLVAAAATAGPAWQSPGVLVAAVALVALEPTPNGVSLAASTG